jgi:hypothetical protein
MRNKSNLPAENSQGDFFRVTTSVLVLLVSFIVVNLLHHLFQAYLSEALGYDTKISFSRVVSSPHYARYWNMKRIVALYATPLVGFLTLGFLCFFFLERRKQVHTNEDGALWLDKLSTSGIFLFWIGLCSVSLTITHLALTPIGTINPLYNPFFQDASVVAIWLKIPPVGLIILSVVSMIMALVIGFYFGKHFAERFAYGRNVLTKTSGRLKIAIFLYIIPVVSLFPLAYLLTYPNSPYVHLGQILVLLWMSIGVFMFFELRAAQLHKLRCADEAKRKSIDLFILLVLLVVGIKLILKY